VIVLSGKNEWSFADGILRKNPLLFSGMLAAPAAVFCNTVYHALSYAAVFSAVTIITLFAAKFVPRRLAYALRIILYTVLAAAVYIPIYMLLDGILPVKLSSFGVFSLLIVSGSFIVSASELRFFRLSTGKAFLDIISHVLGFDIAVIILGGFRELLSTGGLFGNLYGISVTLPRLSSPFAGFILIGLFAAAVRVITRKTTAKD